MSKLETEPGREMAPSVKDLPRNQEGLSSDPWPEGKEEAERQGGPGVGKQCV